jgi:cobalt/nickel transport system ATP-binding protein
MEPDIIIMDEPSIALDPRNRRNLIKILNEIEALKIVTSHDLDFIMDTCKRVVLLDEGRIIADGNTDEILKDKELLESHGLELPLSLSRR